MPLHMNGSCLWKNTKAENLEDSHSSYNQGVLLITHQILPILQWEWYKPFRKVAYRYRKHRVCNGTLASKNTPHHQSSQQRRARLQYQNNKHKAQCAHETDLSNWLEKKSYARWLWYNVTCSDSSKFPVCCSGVTTNRKELAKKGGSPCKGWLSSRNCACAGVRPSQYWSCAMFKIKGPAMWGIFE